MSLPKGIWIPIPDTVKAPAYVLGFVRMAMRDRAVVEPSRALFEDMADSARLVDLEVDLPKNFYKGLGPNVDSKSFALGFNAALRAALAATPRGSPTRHTLRGICPDMFATEEAKP